MGCCESKNIGRRSYEESIKDLIETGNIQVIKSLYRLAKKNNEKLDINSIEYKINETFSVTPLGFSLLVGQDQVFKMILEQLGGDFEKMEQRFSKYETSGLSIICLNNYLTMLQVYLPRFLVYKKSGKSAPSFSNSTIHSTDLNPSLTPIQIACENGHISILNYFKSISSSITVLPLEIDVHYIDESSGNNCALIACKNNNFTMIKYLHTHCSADFMVINMFGENALNVLALGSKENSKDTMKCIEYLVEKIGVDLVYNFQETLMMLEEEESVRYFEQKLLEKGVTANKKDFEGEGQVDFAKRTICKAYDTGNRFTFIRLFPDLLKGVNENGSFIE